MTRANYALAALLVASLLITPAAGSDIYGVDRNHDLAGDSAIEQFETEGVASGTADDLDMQLSIAKDCADVGHDPMVAPPQRCLQVQYNEEVARTVRVYVPSEYWTPFEDQSMESTNGEVAAEMEPISGRDYTAITLHFDGKTDAVFSVNMVESKLWSARQKATSWSTAALTSTSRRSRAAKKTRGSTSRPTSLLAVRPRRSTRRRRRCSTMRRRRTTKRRG